MRCFVERCFWSLSEDSGIPEVGFLVRCSYSWLSEAGRPTAWGAPGDRRYTFALQWDPCFVCVLHHLLKGLLAINPGRVPSWWIICWWGHERSNIAGDEMPASSWGVCVWWDSSAGQTRFPWGCSGACTDGAHGEVWREGRLKPPGFFLCPLQGLGGCTLMEAFQKGWLAEEAGLFTWRWLVSMGSRRTPSRRPSGNARFKFWGCVRPGEGGAVN